MLNHTLIVSKVLIQHVSIPLLPCHCGYNFGCESIIASIKECIRIRENECCINFSMNLQIIQTLARTAERVYIQVYQLKAMASEIGYLFSTMYIYS